jgi:hypothetical protein
MEAVRNFETSVHFNVTDYTAVHPRRLNIVTVVVWNKHRAVKEFMAAENVPPTDFH